MRDARNHGVEGSKASLVDILNSYCEDYEPETVCLDNLAREVANISDGGQENQAKEGVEEKLSSFALQLNGRTLARSLLDIHGHLSEEASKALFTCQRAINVDKFYRVTQTTIDNHFSKK